MLLGWRPRDSKQTRWAAGLCMLACALAGCSADSVSGPDRGSVGSTPLAGLGNKGAAGAAGSMTGSTDFGNTMPSTPAAPVDMNMQSSVDAGTTGMGPDDNNCGSVEVTPMVHMTEMTTTTTTPGNLLIIFDKSLSMNEGWSGGSSKWQAATSAITQAVTSLQNDIAMAGAIFFPWNDFPDGCNVDPVDSGSQIAWMAGTDFVPAWSSWIGSHSPGGFTPTDAAAQQADAALGAELPMLMGTTAVVFITDGDPTCGTSNASVAVQLAGKWLNDYGIKTYVVGLPGTSASGEQVLTSLATAGGTMTYTSPNDATGLQNLLSQIVTSSVMTMTTTTTSFDSCMVTLPMQPPNPDDVHLVVTEAGVKQDVARDLGSGGGWTLSADGTEIVLQGLFCDYAKMGKYEKISVAFGCVSLPPLPPPQPPS